MLAVLANGFTKGQSAVTGLTGPGTEDGAGNATDHEGSFSLKIPKARPAFALQVGFRFV